MSAQKTMFAIFAFPILIVSLALGIFALTRTRELHLPSPDVSLALSILLPILTLLTFMLPDEQRSAVELPSGRNTFTSSFSSSGNFAWIKNILPTTSQASKVITLFAVILLTLSTSDLSRLEVPECLTEHRWVELYLRRDNAIRAIQDQLHCCGLNSPKDRAWPWVSDAGENACLQRYPDDPERSQGCHLRLADRFRTVQGAMTGSAVAILVVQLLVAYFVQISDRRVTHRTNRNRFHDNRFIEEAAAALGGNGPSDNPDRFVDDMSGEDAESSTRPRPTEQQRRSVGPIAGNT